MICEWIRPQHLDVAPLFFQGEQTVPNGGVDVVLGTHGGTALQCHAPHVLTGHGDRVLPYDVARAGLFRGWRG
jgi:hypothetical protein